MEIGSPVRAAVAWGLVGLAGLIGYLLNRDLSAMLLVLVAGGAAVLLVASRASPGSPAADLQPVEPARDWDMIEAFDDPVVVVAGMRVEAANAAARAVLGDHIAGEDARLALRHPAAAESLLSGAPGDDPIPLAGLGARDQHWDMRVRATDNGRRIVHLADRTGMQAADRIRVDFVANASHELRTPLASLLGFIETLSDEAGGDPVTRHRFLKVMDDEARRMQRLIDDLISLSRIEAEKYRAPDQPVDLAALAAEVRDEIASSHDARAADVVLDTAAAAVVLGDRAQLSQLLHNVVVNAMKYGRAGTPVTIAIAPADTMVRLSVGDRGDGIAPEHLPRLTERFYRVDSGRSRSIGGTGLGLAIVKHIVERHRGRLDIASTPGVGTTVTILLPAMSQSGNATATQDG